MTDFLIKSNYDIDLSTGDIQLVQDADAIAQHLRIRLNTFLGEWFLDTRIGMPYYQNVFVKNPNLSVVRSIFRKAIQNTPGVETVNDLDLNFTSSTRSLAISFRALAAGSDVPIEFDEEFII